MQKPLNTSERNSTFLKFLLFFLLSVAMVTAAIYLDFKMPIIENKILKEKTEYVRLQNQEQEKITNLIVDVKTLIDSVEKPGVNVKYITDIVQSKLGDLNKLNVGDSSIQKKMNNVIVSVLFQLNDLKSKTSNMGETQRELSDLTSQNIKLKGDVRDLEVQITNLRNMTNQR